MGTIVKAIRVAIRYHNGQVRKGTEIPYMTHPLSVGIFLANAGCSNEVVAAGILHDTVEDTDMTIEKLVVVSHQCLSFLQG